MRVFRQFGTFVLGVGVGVAVYALLRFSPLMPSRWIVDSGWNSFRRTAPPLVLAYARRPIRPCIPAPAPTETSKPADQEWATIELPTFPQPDLQVQPAAIVPGSRAKRRAALSAKLLKDKEEHRKQRSVLMAREARAVRRKEARLAATIHLPQQPVSLPDRQLFKAVGYVEKSNGEMEAIVMQDNDVHVVHIGDEVGGRYRVTSISPNMVSAVDETVLQVPMVGSEHSRNNDRWSSDNMLPANSQDASRLSAVNFRSEPLISTEKIFPSTMAQSEELPDIGFNPNPPQGNGDSLGYIQKSDGKIEAVVADGDTVRLVPQTTEVQGDRSLARAATGPFYESPMSLFRQHPYQVNSPGAVMSANRPAAPVETVQSSNARGPMPGNVAEATAGGSAITSPEPPLGFIEFPAGNFGFAYATNQGVNVVWGSKQANPEGATRSGDSVVEPNRLATSVPLPISNRPQFSSLQFGADYPVALSEVKSDTSRASESVPDPAQVPPAKREDSPESAASIDGPVVASQRDPYGRKQTAPTFIFQTLGYVVGGDGQVKAIVAEGPDTYLVRKGEIFADQYRATSVDPFLVLAVKLPEAKPLPGLLGAQTESQAKLASNQVLKYAHKLNAENLGLLSLGESGRHPRSEAHYSGPGINLFNVLPTGSDLTSDPPPSK